MTIRGLDVEGRGGRGRGRGRGLGRGRGGGRGGRGGGGRGGAFRHLTLDLAPALDPYTNEEIKTSGTDIHHPANDNSNSAIPEPSLGVVIMGSAAVAAMALIAYKRFHKNNHRKPTMSATEQLLPTASTTS